MITQKLLIRFSQNLAERWHMGRGRNSLIFVIWMCRVRVRLQLGGRPSDTSQYWICRWGPSHTHNTGYLFVLPGICLTVTILRDQWTWWRLALYWVPFHSGYCFVRNVTLAMSMAGNKCMATCSVQRRIQSCSRRWLALVTRLHLLLCVPSPLPLLENCIQSKFLNSTCVTYTV